MPKIHQTAVVHPRAQLADDVEIGPFAVVEQDVVIGPGCRLANNAVIRQYTTIGSNNVVDSFAVLGGLPQDYKFDAAGATYLRIGNDNIFREGVTISRATGPGNATIVGNHTYWMTCAHAGHNAVVEDDAILVNGAALGGYAVLGRRSILSAHVVVHQFTWIGEGVMTQGNAGLSSHVPPFSMCHEINRVCGVNVVGIARSKDLTDEDRRQIREAHRMLYRSGLTPAKALAKMDLCTDWGEPAGRFRDFVRKALTSAKPYNRGLCQMRRGRPSRHAAEA